MRATRKNGTPTMATEQAGEQSTGKTSWADLVDVEEKSTNGEGTIQNLESNLKSSSNIVGRTQLKVGFDLLATESPVTNVKITIDD